jgi:hypothetical protein
LPGGPYYAVQSDFTALDFVVDAGGHGFLDGGFYFFQLIAG